MCRAPWGGIPLRAPFPLPVPPSAPLRPRLRFPHPWVTSDAGVALQRWRGLVEHVPRVVGDLGAVTALVMDQRSKDRQMPDQRPHG